MYSERAIAARTERSLGGLRFVSFSLFYFEWHSVYLFLYLSLDLLLEGLSKNERGENIQTLMRERACKFLLFWRAVDSWHAIFIYWIVLPSLLEANFGHGKLGHFLGE